MLPRPAVALLLLVLLSGCAVGFPAEKQGVSINGGKLIAHRSVPLTGNRYRFDTNEFSLIYPAPWRTEDVDLTFLGITGVLTLAYGTGVDGAHIDGDQLNSFLASSLDDWAKGVQHSGDRNVVVTPLVVGGLRAVRVDSLRPDSTTTPAPVDSSDPNDAVSPSRHYTPLRELRVFHNQQLWSFTLRTPANTSDVHQAQADFDAMMTSLVWSENVSPPPTTVPAPATVHTSAPTGTPSPKVP
jgi:hypothetical protein